MITLTIAFFVTVFLLWTHVFKSGHKEPTQEERFQAALQERENDPYLVSSQKREDNILFNKYEHEWLTYYREQIFRIWFDAVQHYNLKEDVKGVTQEQRDEYRSKYQWYSGWVEALRSEEKLSEDEFVVSQTGPFIAGFVVKANLMHVHEIYLESATRFPDHASLEAEFERKYPHNKLWNA